VAATAFQARALEAGATSYRILLDGLPMPECGFVHEALVDGDALCYSIAAAGIMAKEVRDLLMRRLAVRYPAYGWDANAGYATADHCKALTSLGPTPHHRMSFTPVAQHSLDL
jgi:ribonuclease HII